ncbi:Ig-like domain-containing protein, partial [Corallococcus exiguus]|uniref:Ig-like domain-containing protein n=3 Tax=Myxococcaceae TaxID=31 RepID=UPI0014719B72
IIPGPPKWNQNSFYFVRGTPTVSWSIVQSVSGVAVARIFQDSVLLTSLAGSGGINYFIHWDTSVLSDGRHTISLEATDRAGNVSSHSRFVDVDNTPPAYLAITAPYNGAQVSGVVTLSATGSDNMDLASIAFQVDGTTLTPFATTAPYTRTWNSTGLSGTHTIVAIAYDRAGNSARSAPVTVTVP